MESFVPLFTRLRNDTGHCIDFLAEEGTNPFPRLKPGGRRYVNLSKIFKICRRRGSANWQIKVLIDKKFTGLILEAEDFLSCVLITFKFRAIENNKFIVIAEAVNEKPVDIVLRLSWNIGFLMGRNMIWNRRKSDEIAEALPKYAVNKSKMRQKDNKVGEAPKFLHRSPKDSIKRSRKAESPQLEIKSKDSVKSSERDLHLDKDADVLVQNKKVASPKRKTTTGNTVLAGSIYDAFETRTRNSTNIDLEREVKHSDYLHHHQQQQLIEHVECDSQPPSSNALNMDGHDHIFLFVFSLLLVGFFRVLLLGFEFTLNGAM